MYMQAMVCGKKSTTRYVRLVQRCRKNTTLHQLDVSDSAFLTTSAYTVSTKKLLRMDRYGPKHVELTPEY